MDVETEYVSVGNDAQIEVVQRFILQSLVNEIIGKVDSDHAGCIRTRKSTTGLAIFQGKHVIKAASSTQTVIALSSGGSEFYAIVRGVATGLGLKSMAKDYGIEIAIVIETDSVAGRGMELRLGAGKVRHVELSVYGNRDLNKGNITKNLNGFGFKVITGRSGLALRAVL